MRNSGLPGADGPANILGAIRVALSPQAHGIGPLVVFSDEIHLPRFVRKTHSSSVSAFTSPNAGPIGWITEDRVRIALRPNSSTETFDISGVRDIPNIGIISIGLGSPALPSAVIACHDALIIQSFGGGHVPSFMVESLAEASKIKHVVLATRTGAGEIHESTYALKGVRARSARARVDQLGRARRIQGAPAAYYAIRHRG
nr:asparaginase domain-containing protein [Rhodococcus sp. 06-621-2]